VRQDLPISLAFRDRRLNCAYALLLLITIVLGSSVCAQNFVPISTQVKEIRDSLKKLPRQGLSDSTLSMYWLNRSWVEQKLSRGTGEEPTAFDAFLDSANYRAQKANCNSCTLYIDLVKANSESLGEEYASLPPLPQETNPSLELHHLGTELNKCERERTAISIEKINRIKRLIKNPEINLLQRVVMADMLATYVLYPKGELQQALKLYQFGARTFSEPEFNESMWRVQLELPGIYTLPAQKISRCFLNAAIIQREQGDFKGATQNLIQGTQIYKTLRDTLGLLWAYRDLSHVYTFQQDYENAKAYLDSTLHITRIASERLLKSHTKRYSEFLRNHYELAFNAGVGKALFEELKAQLSDRVTGTFTPTETEVLDAALLDLNLATLDNYWNDVPLNLKAIEALMPLVEQLDLSQKATVDDLRSLLKSQYALIQTKLSSDSNQKEGYKRAYQKTWRNIRSMGFKKAFYVFSRPYLMEMRDYDFLLQQNRVLSKIYGEISMPMMQLVEDRSTAWQNLEIYDSALYSLQAYTRIKDSLINQQNYIKLARADLKLKTAESERKSQLLLAQNKTSKQQILFLMIAALALLVIAVLFRQRRVKDGVISKRNAELLELRAQSEVQRNEILKHKNNQLEKELRVNIVQSLQQQNHNLELAEMIQELKSTTESSPHIDKKTHELKRKLGEHSVESTLYELEKQAVKVYPELYQFLKERLSTRNKMELMLCIMLVMNYTSEDIARLLQRSEKAIRSLRYRVRKRLELEGDQDLVKYLKKHVN
jgi:DNA-binding CsgD family transcriptional regulator